MPSALRIRKDILKALDKSIIPALWKQQVPLGYVAPPLQFPSNIESAGGRGANMPAWDPSVD